MSFDESAIHVCFTGMKSRICQQFPILVGLSAVVFLAGCSKADKADSVSATPQPTAHSKQPGPSASPAKTEAFAGTDACTLLTKEEIQAVQGEPFKDTKGTGKTGAGLSVSQCYFELPQAVNSIVVTVTQKAEGPGARDPANNWKEIFHRDEKAEKKEEEAEKEPEKVDGIGDEAFWTGNRVGGALYVLKGNSYIRISVGGAGDQEAKIKKSKALAQSILKRL
jgi:hypothetical protein